LGLQYNKLEGQVPEELNQLKELRQVTMESNMLTSLPDLSLLENIFALNIYDNFFTFKDIEPNLNLKINDLPVGGSGWFSYSPQKKIGKEQSIFAKVGLPYVLTVSCGGDHSSYQWFKDGQSITHPKASPEYPIDFVEAGYNGKYICKVTNSVVKDLILEYNPITLVGGTVVGIFPAKINTEGIRVYPNPTNGIITIEGLPTKGEIDIALYNILGNLIKKEIIEVGKSQLDITYEKKGTYFLVIQNHFDQAIKIIKE
jgi:hypothetical protein